MRTRLAFLCVIFLLCSCGTGFKTPPITIPEITIPSITLQHDSIRQPVKVTTHTSAAGVDSYTLDTVARAPHKARVRIATLYSKGDADFICQLWNASIAVTP